MPVAMVIGKSAWSQMVDPKVVTHASFTATMSFTTAVTTASKTIVKLRFGFRMVETLAPPSSSGKGVLPASGTGVVPMLSVSVVELGT
jgi:hypothetical protein